MLKVGIIIFLGAIIGWSLTHLVMLANFWRRRPPRELVLREFLSVFADGGIGKNYMALLAEAHIEPAGFDKVLYALHVIFVWSFIGGTILVTIGIISVLRS